MEVTPKVAIINNDLKTLNSLSHLLGSIGYQVQVYHSGNEFLQNAPIEEINCLLLDVFLPGMSGLEIQETLKRRQIDISVIFITAQGDIEMAVRAMKNDAIDFLSKSVSDHVLLEAINKAIQQDAKRRAWKKVNAEVIARSNQLTRREHEVMGLMVAGFSTKRIATELGISPSTVELHRAKVMKKMAVRSIAELVHLALVNKLVSPLQETPK